MYVSIPKRVSEALKLDKGSKNPNRCAFQSLKGFQRLWSKETTEILKKVAVSIPKRVSEALKLHHRQQNRALRNRVSIPKRVSEALKPFGEIAAAERKLSFQSLKGFQRLWSWCIPLRAFYWNEFQSLKGFQRLWSVWILFFIWVISLFQSLKGFQRLWSFFLEK